MKIAMLVKDFVTTGGSNRYAVELSTRLLRRGHEIHLYAQHWDPALVDGFILHRIPSFRRPRFLNSLFYAIRTMFLLKHASIDVSHSHQRTIDHDVVSMHHPCYTIHRHGRVPSGRVLTMIRLLLNPRHLVYRWLEFRQFGCRSLKYVIAVSERTKRDILAHYRLDAERVRVIYPGVDYNRMSMEGAREQRRVIRRQYDIAEDDLVLVLVGSEFKRKGLRFAIEALHRLEQEDEGQGVPHLFVIGGGADAAFREQVLRYGLESKVHFIGLSTRVQQFYNAADLLVLPTLNEPFGMVVLEAMANGLPAIVSRDAGVTEVLNDGEQAILLDDPRDVDQIVAAIRRLRDDVGRMAMGQRARGVAKQFTWDRMVDEVERLYREVTQRKGDG